MCEQLLRILGLEILNNLNSCEYGQESKTGHGLNSTGLFKSVTSHFCLRSINHNPSST
jgi:hypothetical protein